MNAYEGRTGLPRLRISRLMTEETWMDAQRAKELGFVDEILGGNHGLHGLHGGEGVEKAAMVNALRNFVNVPAALLAPALPQEPVREAAAERLRAEVKIYI